MYNITYKQKGYKMSRFVDNKIYYFKLRVEADGLYLVSLNSNEYILLNSEILAYYLENYTLQKGTFVNSFRKILCEDGVTRFYNKEHPEYKAALKAETISIKDISEGTVLADSRGNEFIYIGSFYQEQYRRPKRKRAHFFYRKERKEIVSSTDLKRYKLILGVDPKYTSKLVNFRELCSSKSYIYLIQK
jgi:hypothetical protein